MKKGLLAFFVIVVLIIAGIIGVGVFYNTGLSPLEKSSGDADKKIIRVEIKEGMGISQIANLLEKEGIIRSANLMKIYSKLNNVKGLQAGKYDLSPEDDTKTIIAHIVDGKIADDSVKITFIEGITLTEAFRLLEQNKVCSYEALMNAAQNYGFTDYKIYSDIPVDENRCFKLEGYLFPDTYDFEISDSICGFNPG